jgi:hypothetical protein
MKYALTRPQFVRPSNLSRGEAEVVYMCLEADDLKPKTFEELVIEAKARKLESHFKRRDSTTIEESLNYWLRLFSREGWVRLTDDK